MAEICTTIVLPEVESDYCAPVVRFGEVERIFIGNPDQPAFGDWKVDTEWLSRLDDDDMTDNTFIRTLRVKASKPAPDVSSFEIDGGRTINATQKNSMPFVIYEVTDKTRNFCKYVNEQNGITIPFWYATREDQYGTNEGMSGYLTMYEVIPDDRAAAITIEGTLTWEAALEDRTALVI